MPTGPQSKTKPRKVVLHDSIAILQEYLEGREPETALWPDGRMKGLGYHSWKTTLNTIIKKARATDLGIIFPKGCKSHLFRHSRATYLANQGWNEAMLMKRFGWTEPRMASHYVEQSRIDTGAAFDRMSQGQVPQTQSRSSNPTNAVPWASQTEVNHEGQMRYCPNCGFCLDPASPPFQDLGTLQAAQPR